MKKYIAYMIIIIGFAFPIFSEIISGSMFEELRISDGMYESSKGLKAIIAIVEARLAGKTLRAVSLSVFVFLLGLGTLILLSEKIGELKNRIEQIEHKLKNKP